MMEYKGYRAESRYSLEDDAFIGKIAGIDDMVIFEGQTQQQLQKMFHVAVDDYLTLLRENGRPALPPREPADDITDDIWEMLRYPHEEPTEDCAEPPDKYPPEEIAPRSTLFMFFFGFFSAIVAQLVKMLLELL